MGRTFCFSFEYKKSGKEFENAIKKLYGDDPSFKDKNEIPVYCCFSEMENNRGCVTFLKSSKKLTEAIDKINTSVSGTKKMKRLGLGEPIEQTIDSCEWWGKTSEDAPDYPKNWKWNTLSHNGPYFQDIEEPYIPKKLKLQYSNQKLDLNADEERVLMYYAKSVVYPETVVKKTSEKRMQDSTFTKNYMNDLKMYLTSNNKKIIKNISNINWKNFLKVVEKEKPDNLSEKQKYERKCKNKNIDIVHGFAMVNGFQEKVSSGKIVEPAGIFMGRGKNPNRGKIKKIIRPSDVIINIGKKAEVPKPPVGKWKQVVHDHEGEYLAKFSDTFGENKYTRIDASGQFKSENDYIKFEIARKLNRDYKSFQDSYRPDLSNNDSFIRQLATSLYLIENFGIRPGGEKSKEAGVVGATTLEVENVKSVNHLKSGDYNINLDFIGKDSIRFKKTLKVDGDVGRNISEFIKGKNSKDVIFDLITSSNINDYIQQFNKLYSAKMFRTRLASETMYNALKKIKVNKKKNCCLY